MSLKKGIVIGALVLGLGGLGHWAVRALLQTEPRLCQVCARPIGRGQEFTLVLSDGVQEHTCCPRCGMHAELLDPKRIHLAWATDHATGARIESRRAVYVEGSDLMTCCLTPALKRGPETASELVWDRCLPRLAAFKDETEAKRFQRQHGGRLLSYAQAIESVKGQ